MIKASIVILLLGGLGVSLFLVASVYNDRGALGPFILLIPRGASLGDIASIAEEANLLSSPRIFRAWATIAGYSGKLKPGRYRFDQKPSVAELIYRLEEGPREIVVTVVPGMTIREVDDVLSRADLIASGQLIDFSVDPVRGEYPWIPQLVPLPGTPLEGFLLPDTYHFYEGEGVGEMVITMLDNFKRGVLPRILNHDTLYRTVTIASILEKEVSDPHDERLVAGILEKRLSVGMPLNVDATVVYVACGGRYLGCGPVRKSDYNRPSPYNTYYTASIPPGPIGSPSLAAIDAALQPMESEYWYYLSNPQNRETIFSKTLDEQERNRAKYLKN